MGPVVSAAGARNLILASLPARDAALVEPHLEAVTLDLKRVLYDPDQPIEHVYFPDAGMVSLLAVMLDGTGVEIASTGYEGMVGMPVFHGTDRIAEQAVVQLPGSARRMTSAAFRECVKESDALSRAVARYAACVFMFAAQSGACTSKHLTERRLARWLLHAADQSGSERLALTHLFAAQMLSVRRSSVTVAAGSLRSKGLISYSRRHIDISDRPGLEVAACECYGIIRSTYERLLHGNARANPNAGVRASHDGLTVLTEPHADDAEPERSALEG
jgi:CRP-like cAMP-binding protein